VNEIGLQVCLVPSRCPPEAPERSFEAAPLVPLQMTALSCLVIVRRLGALEDVARELGLKMFEQDEELFSLLQDACGQEKKNIVSCTQAAYVDCLQKFSNGKFQKSLEHFYLTIL